MQNYSGEVFGAVAGSPPIALVLVTIPILAALHLVGGKVKGETMETKAGGRRSAPKGPKGPARKARKGRSSTTRTTANSVWTSIRKVIGQMLIVVAGMGSSMSAGVASSALLKGSWSRTVTLSRIWA